MYMTYTTTYNGLRALLNNEYNIQWGMSLIQIYSGKKLHENDQDQSIFAFAPIFDTQLLCSW